MKKYHKILFAVILATSCIPLVVLSAEADPVDKKKKERYFQGYLGSVKNDTQAADKFDINTTDYAIGAGLGYQVGRNMFVDVRFVYLGEFETSDNTYKESFSALTASFLGRYPFDDSGFNFYGSLGYGFLSWKYTLDIGLAAVEVKDTGDTVTAGLGVQYLLPNTKGIVVSLGYDQYYFLTAPVIGPDDTEGNTLRVFALSLQYRN